MKHFLKTKDFAVTGEEFELVHDPRLDMLITKPQPRELEKYYDSDAYISHTDSRQTVTERLYSIIKRISMHRKVKLIDAFAGPQKTLLDVGTGTGGFLLNAQSAG